MGLDVDEFCALPKIPDVDDEIATSERELTAVQKQDELGKLPLFKEIEMPTIDSNLIKEVLLASLDDLDSAAGSKVRDHVRSLGNRGETWVSAGMDYIDSTQDTCPFCGQQLSLSDLIGHYQTYFSDEYANLKQSISRIIADIETDHRPNQRTDFERSFRVVE